MAPNPFKFILLCQTNIIFLVYHFLSISLRDSKSVQLIILCTTLGELSYPNSVPPPRITLEDEYIYSLKTLWTLGKLILHQYNLSILCWFFSLFSSPTKCPQATSSILHNSTYHNHHLNALLGLVRLFS